MIQAVAHIDFETRATVDLLKSGAYPYFEGPQTKILCLAYKLGAEPTRSWVPGQPDPQPLLDHIASGGPVMAHNNAFDRTCWNAKTPAHWPRLKLAQCDCTMARAASLGLPQSLAYLGDALKISLPKDADGHRLMMLMCKPNGYDQLGFPLWRDSPAMRADLTTYNRRDVDAEHEISHHLPPLSARERRVWLLDQEINDRGVLVDLPLVRRAAAVVEEAKGRADKAMWKLTDGAVKKVTEAKRIVDWVNAKGLPCESIAEGEFEGLLVGAELFDEPVVADVVRLRQASAKAFKFPAMIAHACADGRVRGSLAYHGAFNGRWAGRGIQPQNFKRIEDEDDEAVVKIALTVLTTCKSAADGVDLLEMLVDSPLDALSICSRPMLCAAPGKKLVGGDFSNIEGRIAAWLAGETWKLQAFRDYDAGTGPDLYRVMASRILEKSVDRIDKPDRQLWGKVPELACGYQGGFAAFQRMGAKYGVRLPESKVMPIVRGWREGNPRIVAAWGELQEAALNAVSAPGCVVTALGGRISYVVANGFLFCKLPVGRVIAYVSPTIEWKTKEVTIDGELVEVRRYGVSYWGEKKGWRKLDLYGGAQFAHVVSGTARDVLVDAMFRVTDAGYPIVLTVHDEILAETPLGFGSAAEVERLMATSEPWLDGLPVSVKVWEGPRYDK